MTAIEYYERALEVCPQAGRKDVNYRLGVSAACAERFDKAESAFRRCMQLQTDQAMKDQIERILQVVDEIRQGRKDPVLFRVMVQLQRAFSDMEAERYSSAAERL